MFSRRSRGAEFQMTSFLAEAALRNFKSQYTVKLFDFAAINFRVLLMAWQFASINFRVSLACPIGYNGSVIFSWRFIFAIISSSRISQK